MMRLRKGDWLFGAAVLAVILFVAVLPSPREQNPVIPADTEHRSIASEKHCSQCHGTQASRPLPDRHPKRQDCFKCHRRGEALGG